MQYITRRTTFDAAHRVMNEKRKCFNVHGHLYVCEMTFAFQESESIGYALDFKEIKRVYCQWIDDILDHGAILNPKDVDFIQLCQKLKSKYWVMSLNGDDYCNPSVENIAKELFLALNLLTKNYPLLTLDKIKLFETENCFTLCFADSISNKEQLNWSQKRAIEVTKYANEKGIVEYDDRKINFVN